MNEKAAYAKRAVTLRKIKRLKIRVVKFKSYLDEIIAAIESIEKEKSNAKRRNTTS